MKWCLHLMLVLATVQIARADEVEFPEEELAKESVLPVFENRTDVLHRHVITNQRFEVGVGGGLEINEPFYSDVLFTGRLGYHLTDLQGINVEGLYWTPGLSSYGQQLKANTNIHNFDASKAPHSRYGAIANYEFTAYYGKISLTKQMVMNLNLFAYAGPLFINMNGYNSFGGDIGLGQNFFISPSFALRLDLRMLIFKAPNAAGYDLSTLNVSNPNPKPSDFPERVFFNNQAELSLVFLL